MHNNLCMKYYHLPGIPIRLISALLKRLPFGQPTSELIGQSLLFLANILSTIRNSVEVVDTFVGRYLVFSTTVYIAFKFLHFKFFNGIIP